MPSDKPQGIDKESKSQSFEKGVQRLEEIVANLEGGSAKLDEALELYQEGVGLVKNCQKKLSEIRRKVEILDKETEKLAPLGEGGGEP